MPRWLKRGMDAGAIKAADAKVRETVEGILAQVEDNKDAAESLQLLLTMLGHEVRVAATGPDGVRVATEWAPEVILSDIGLLILRSRSRNEVDLQRVADASSLAVLPKLTHRLQYLVTLAVVALRYSPSSRIFSSVV